MITINAISDSQNANNNHAPEHLLRTQEDQSP
jgi:hypothetical protein